MLEIDQYNNITFQHMGLNETVDVTLLFDGIHKKTINYTDKNTKEPKSFVKNVCQVEYQGKNVYVNNLSDAVAQKLCQYPKGTTVTVKKVNVKNWFDVYPAGTSPVVKLNSEYAQDTQTPPIPMKRLEAQLTPRQAVLYKEVMDSKILENEYTRKDWEVVGETIPWKE